MTKNEAHLPMSRAALIAIVVALTLSIAATFPVFGLTAYADEEKPDYQKTALELQQQIEACQADLETAQEEANEAAAAIDETQARIDSLEQDIPAQQARSAEALRDEYKLQHQSAGIVDMLLSSGSFQEFIDGVEYMNRASNANMAEVLRLRGIKDEIVATQNELQQTRQTAEEKASDARTALAAAQEAQAEVQRRIEEEARIQAEIAARAAALAAQERANDSGEAVNANGEAKPGQEGDSGSQDAGSAPAAEAAPAPEPAAVDASSGEAAFVAEWAPRIDAYLAGSPLAGQGTTFAKAAFKYGVDPRFSPAISFTESSKGAVCFKPHNAWGWGSSSWSTWEEAIYDHVAGLARGYGGQISEAAAKKYCPPTWQSWYKRTLGQMELI